ncbi:dopamine receptor 1-like isoform X2 [Symsagittifera roscoffensis]|uniref:dopamine receptor 1-like isoform X2 n=1 Tax=Symsagittifera roscoffensis TaxID=84072 RepID=UPI00307C238E
MSDLIGIETISNDTTEEYIQLPRTVDVFLTTLQLVIVAIGVGANLAVIYATITRFSCKKASNLFVCTLACIDVLALLYDLGGITVSLCGGGSSCEFRPCIVTSMGNAVTFMSAFNLVLIAFDRYIFIEHPFQYSKVIEKRTRLWLFFFLVFPAILLIALFCVTFCQPIMHHLFYIVPALIILFICLVAIVFMYSSIFITARSHHRKLAVQLCNGAAETQKNFMSRFDAAQRRIIVGYILIVGVFFLSVLMIWISGIIMSPHSSLGGVWFARMSYLVVTLNSACNPFIYYFTNREYRDGFLSMIGCDKTTV